MLDMGNAHAQTLDINDVALTNNHSDEAIGIRIQAVRFVAGETQSQFGARIGASGNVVGNWERGAATPRYHHLASICFEYLISADFILLGRLGQMTRDQQEAYTPALQRATLEQKAKNAAKAAREAITQSVAS